MASYSSTANGPRAMSQNGALEMANAGRSAGEILAAYYGIRPTTAGDRLPATIRVALDTSVATVRVSADRPFRVVDETGAELAATATGDWKVVRHPAGVQVVPPEGQVAPPSTEPAPPLVHRPGRAISAAVPLAGPGPWAATAAVFVVAAAGATITLGRRRRA